MSSPTRIQAGDEIQLVVDVQNAEGGTVVYRIVSGNGDELAQLEATVTDGVARVSWVAGAGEHRLPQQLSFFVSIANQTLRSGELTLDPPGVIAVPAWLLLSSNDGAPPRGELGPLELGDATIRRDASEPDRPLNPGDPIGLLVHVADSRGEPLVGDFDLIFELQKRKARDSDDFQSVKQYVRTLSAPSGVSEVAARWTMDTMGLPPPYAFRFLVSWKRRPGEQSTTPSAAQSQLRSVTV